MAKVTVTENTIERKLTALRKAGPDAVHEFVTELTLDIHARAVRGIKSKPATGRIYRKSNPNRTHTASAPGEYPMSDTGRLASSIQFELPTNRTRPQGVVGTNLNYGKFLEFKPANRGGRPWLSRAVKESTAKADTLLQRVFKRRSKV